MCQKVGNFAATKNTGCSSVGQNAGLGDQWSGVRVASSRRIKGGKQDGLLTTFSYPYIDHLQSSHQLVRKEKQNNKNKKHQSEEQHFNYLITKYIHLHCKTYMFYHPIHICLTLPKFNFDNAKHICLAIKRQRYQKQATKW